VSARIVVLKTAYEQYPIDFLNFAAAMLPQSDSAIALRSLNRGLSCQRKKK
jgi:hypothetical protein